MADDYDDLLEIMEEFDMEIVELIEFLGDAGLTLDDLLGGN